MTQNKAYAAKLGLLYESRRDGSVTDEEMIPRHVLHVYPSLMPYFPERISGMPPPLENGRPRWHSINPQADMEALQKITQWFIFIGASLSPQFIKLARTSLIFVFEPARKRMDAFLEILPLPQLMRQSLCFFSGAPEAFSEGPLLHLLPVAATKLGAPICFVQEGIPAAFTETVKRTVEICYYHHQIYPYETYKVMDDKRPVASGHSFIQTKHLIENLGVLPSAGTVEMLRDLTPGCTALLVAAGPALDEQIETVRRLASCSIVICAGKACPVLLRAGVTPDIVLLMDARPESAREIANLPLEESILVSYILAGAGTVSCGRTLFYGRELSQLGLPENMIEHLGSVMNYAFFLACLMGCGDAVCVGLQLASRVRHGDGYASGAAPIPGAVQMWPCPVNVPGVAEPLYTSLNFLDVAMWLKAEIQTSGLPVRNLTRDSLLFGPGITYDPEPEIASVSIARPLKPQLQPLSVESGKHVVAALEQYRTKWGLLSEPEKLLAPDIALPLAERFVPLLRKLDANGTSFLLKTVSGFDAAAFAADFFGPNPICRNAAAEVYLTCLRTTALDLKACAEASLARWSVKTETSHAAPSSQFAR